MISFTMLLQRRISVPEFFLYLFAQFLGALMGAAFLLAVVVTPSDPDNEGRSELRYACTGNNAGYFPNPAHEGAQHIGTQSAQALFLAEFLASFFICMTLLASDLLSQPCPCVTTNVHSRMHLTDAICLWLTQPSATLVAISVYINV